EKGVRENDVWQIPFIAPSAKERIGYPTQKPELLLERIIELASNEGDTVLDPFVGGGTTIAVADKLGRKWIGIDQSSMAIKVSDLRLKKQNNAFSQPYDMILRNYDYNILRNSNALEFETWIINKFGGIPNAKQHNDFEPGIDFYAWDFSHSEQNGFKPDVLFDKTGKQTKKFPDGERQVALEAVDREGISGTDKIKIKVAK
ncbi:MAG: site-specific DNA-methyltransferase, partial [Dysgonamonadaceae bacterium]|nr:site-specific DNA-methyltransferase [Dysgonamonadaceae bacterium]